MKHLHASLLLALAAIALGAGVAPSAANAQESAPPPRASARHRHPGLLRTIRRLGVSHTQMTQMREILRQFRQAHPKGSAPDPAARKLMRKQLLAVLTPAQRAQLRSELRARRMRPTSQP